MQKTWDVIVAGVGAMGSAALYQLARRGAKALGIDRFHPPHDRGSSHGDTRITRLALGEGEQYVQFARRSHEIWRELEAATGSILLQQVGGLVYGSSTRRGVAHGAEDFLQTTIAVAQRHAIPHEVLDAEALRARFPQFRFRGDELGCLEHTAGFVHPEACIAAQLEMALQHGAELRTGEQVTAWEKCGEGLRVETDRGSYLASQLIVSAGSWLPGLVAGLGAHARVFRQTLFWFDIDGPRDRFDPKRMPVYIRVPDCGAAMFYGFPAIDGPHGGMKVAGEQFERSEAPDDISLEVTEDEVRAMHDLAAPHVPITSRCLRTVVCKYTVTPDFNFVIDRHPGCDRVWLASACSGHGFKHSAAVGEALAEMCLKRPATFDLSRFKLNRFIQS
jgi:sarcosine oxidase